MLASSGSRGKLLGHVAGTCEDFGIEEGSVSIIIRTFLTLWNETAVHWIDMGPGVLLLAQTKANDAKSGVIYVYDKRQRALWSLKFDEGKGRFANQVVSRQEFEDLDKEYSLSTYAAQPALLASLARSKAGESKGI